MSEGLKPAYLVAGSDWPKVDAAVARMRARFPEESIEQVGDEDGPGDVVGACNAMGLFGGRRLVLVRHADALDEAAVAEVAEYLRDPAPDTVLALFGGEGVTAKHPLAKAVAAVGDVRIFDAPERKEAAAWVARRFAEAGSHCPAAVARRLVELAGEDVGDLALEVAKLVAYRGADEPRVEDVELLVIPETDIKPWDITDAWGRRDSRRAMEVATADVERPDDVGRVVSQLSAHVRKVHRAAALLDRGATQADVARELGLKPYPAQKLLAQARAFSRQELGAAVIRLAAADLAIKGGSRLDPRLELELALADITGA